MLTDLPLYPYDPESPNVKVHVTKEEDRVVVRSTSYSQVLYVITPQEFETLSKGQALSSPREKICLKNPDGTETRKNTPRRNTVPPLKFSGGKSKLSND